MRYLITNLLTVDCRLNLDFLLGLSVFYDSACDLLGLLQYCNPDYKLYTEMASGCRGFSYEFSNDHFLKMPPHNEDTDIVDLPYAAWYDDPLTSCV